ncbi:unnamed protein product [Clonostachys rosea]|uniref:Alcohol dehydrogenase-like C-terminal domain-containing protein n=1 Tax=Bionectria ochroleuca TaxID=29856 RepID=A0ABY6V4B4_BIOOC|nr:unnamed protein product [Clonostachys rosea]
MGFHVVALSSSDSKRQDCMDLGAHHFIDSSATDVVDELNKLGGAKMIVVTAPNADIVKQYTKCLKWQGKLLILAAMDEVGLNVTHLIHNSSSVLGWHAGSPLDCVDAIEFARLHSIKAMTENFPFTQIEKAVAHLNSGKAKYRVVLTMN